MKRTALTLLVGLIAAFSAGSDQWKSFQSANRTFSISFPRTPMVQKSVATYQQYKIDLETALCADGDLAYLTMEWDFSNYPQVDQRKDWLLDNGTASLTKDKGYKVYSSDRFSINGNPGRHLVLRKGRLEQQLYGVFKGRRLVAVIVSRLDGNSAGPAAQKFIASFKLR